MARGRRTAGWAKLTIRKRLLSLSAQKFVSDLSRDAFHFAKLRVSGTTAGRGRPATAVDRNRVVLTMDDLSLALSEHGVNVKKPDYCELATHRVVADVQTSKGPPALRQRHCTAECLLSREFRGLFVRN